ncbi:hypothetical protein [Flavobacterium sp. CGRL2]
MIPRMPLSQFPVSTNQEIEIENAYIWIRKFISEEDWNGRKKKIEDH